MLEVIGGVVVFGVILLAIAYAVGSVIMFAGKR